MSKHGKPIDRSDFTIVRDKKVIKKGKDDSSDTNDFKQSLCWYNMENEDDMAGAIQSTIQYIVDHQPGRIAQLTSSMRLYSNASVSGFYGSSLRNAMGNSTPSSPGSGRISFNLCAAIVDTLTAKMAKNEVVPTFITSGGVWGKQRQAEQLSKFVEGCFYANDAHAVGMECLRDSAVWGTGIMHIFQHNGKVAIERVFPQEIVVDEVEAFNNKPQQLHRVKMVDRNILAAMFKDDEKATQIISEMSVTSSVDMGSVGATAADLVTVTESWHLATSEEANDGCHAISTGGKILFRETYNKMYFPFAFLHYSKRLVGFWGQGAVERVQNLQAEINKLMILIQKCMWMGGGFKILIENGSKVVKQHLDNEVGTIISYTGTPPSYITPPMIQAEIYPYVDSLIAKGFQQEGVSQLAASSLKPEGVDSGTALRTYDKIADDRQMKFAQDFQNFFLEVSRQMIETVKDIYEENKEYKVVYPGTMSFEVIDWGDIHLEADEYVMKAFPTSSLPTEPIAKIATVQEMAQAGLIDPRTTRKLLQMPDIEMSNKLANAPENLLCKIIEDLLNDGDYVAPEPFFDLNLGKRLALEYYNYAMLNNCPQERLALLQEWMTQLDDLLAINEAPPVGPDATVPLANPESTPTSNLIPNINQAA